MRKTTKKQSTKQTKKESNIIPQLYLDTKKSNPRPMVSDFFPPTFNPQSHNY